MSPAAYGLGISPLGTMGLGTTGAYSSYDAYMPYTMGGMYDMSGMGMMGMMPQYYMQLAQMQAAMDKNKAYHSADMHSILMQNEVQAHRETDSMLVEKILTNGDVQNGIKNLYEMVRSGDQDGIRLEFHRLENYINNTYKDEFKARGSKTNVRISTQEIIESIYSRLVMDKNGQPASLRKDIKTYGENALMNGIKQGAFAGHSTTYIDETMNDLFGERINDVDYQNQLQARGKVYGKVAHGVSRFGKGAAVGAAGYTALWGAGKFLNWLIPNVNFLKLGTIKEFCSEHLLKFKGKGLAAAAIIAGVACVAGLCDKWWQVPEKN